MSDRGHAPASTKRPGASRWAPARSPATWAPTARPASRRRYSWGAIPPFLLKTGDNPEGVEGSVFDEIKAAVVDDRPAYFNDFLDNCYNVE
jgi:hypothetical protein